ncbi:MAG: WG repeat-containing protein, partial [Muribaculaceae bacterium]|nr:WG repeat-containing protein [Muribaculaceae bacterium]
MISKFIKATLLSFLLLISAGASAITTGPRVEGQKYGITDLEVKNLYVTAVKGDNGLWGFIDQVGKEKIKPKYQAVGEPQQYEVHAVGLTTPIKQGIIPVLLNGKWGFVNHSGKEVIKPAYDWVGTFKTELKKSGFN